MDTTDRRAFLRNAGVRPDPFQSEALASIDAGRSVLVVAPTGAGKTLVADYAVQTALHEGRTAIYTTPLKALSNQKFRDLTRRLGAGTVGLITGDRVVSPEAPVLVMTTEVLRAMLYEPARSRAIGVVVLDEFHYLQDPERGSAWEEVVVQLPRDVRLVCLSATIPNVEVVHRWLERTHGDVDLVQATRRPIELDFLYAIGNVRSDPPALLPMYVDGQVNGAAEYFDGARRDTRGEGLRVRDRARPVTPERQDLLRELAAGRMLPAIWFVLSRATCDAAARELLASGVRLTTDEEAYRIRSLITESLAGLDSGELRAIGSESWRRALEAGITVHHGGMAPVVREIAETLFCEGLVKLVFATETLALGVNLPARTVVIDRVTRSGGAVLSAGQFAQLAGRSGRRGIDDRGTVVVPWSPDISFDRLADLAGGRVDSIRSEFRVTPAMVANLVHTTGDAGEASAVAEGSLRHWLAMERVDRLRADLAARRTELASIPLTEEHLVEKVVSPDREAIEDALREVRSGDVLVDPSRPAAGPMIVLGSSRKRGATKVEAVRIDARKVSLTPYALRAVPVVVGSIPLGAWAPGQRGQAREAANALAGFEVPPIEPSTPTIVTVPSARRSQLTEAVERLERLVDESSQGVRREFDAVVRLLEGRGHLAGWKLAGAGPVVRRLFHPAGLQLAECLSEGLFSELDPPSLASAASWFTVRSDLRDRSRSGFATGALASTYERVLDVARSITADELAAGLEPSPQPESLLGKAIYRWTSGEPLDVALADTDIPIGDLVREARQVAELLEQLHTVPGPHRPAAETAIERLRRGSVVGERS